MAWDLRRSAPPAAVSRRRVSDMTDIIRIILCMCVYIYIYMYIYMYVYIYVRATPGFCPGVAAYISTIHKQMILQITVIPMGKITKVLGTIKQTRSKHPKFLWEKTKTA